MSTAGKTRGPIRVLVVDDSVLIRRLVTRGLSEDPDIEVAGTAANGAIALRMIRLLRPDVVTLDIEMPEMDGLQTLRGIRRTGLPVKVVMFSTLSERGAAVTLEALSFGANDYVAKPSGTGSLDLSMVRLREELLPKIKQFFPVAAPDPPRASEAQPGIPAIARPSVRRDVVVIGVSTGGPAALAELIPAIPASFRLPILIVQHMPPIFTRHLAGRLQKFTSLRVCEAEDGMDVQPGSVYIAPGGFHMRVVRDGNVRKLGLDRQPPENFCRPAVDVLFRSVAEVYGPAAVGVVLTGMGKDGCAGAVQLRRMGAWIVAQDEPSSVVWGMPGAVARAGAADVIAPLPAVVPEILRQCQCDWTIVSTRTAIS